MSWFLRTKALPITKVAATIAIVAVAALGATASAGAATPTTGCFWIGPYDRDAFDDPELNVAYPDEGAAYWAARFNMPAGSRLILEGRFPHARYMSLNAYSAGAPTDTLTDVAVEPRRDSVNPFAPGARRDLGRSRREFRIEVVDAPAPGAGQPREPNTLYAESPGGVQELMYRVYVPDKGRASAGGVGVPKPELVLADGTRLEGRAACEAINDPVRELPSQRIPVSLYTALVNTPGADFETVPAFAPVRWEAFFNFTYALSVYKVGTPSEPDRELIDTTPSGGQYSNGDARYVIGPINKTYGDLLVLRGKMPTFPSTRGGARRMRDGQVRYWSMCQNESPVTTSVVDCVYDEQVPLTGKRRYTIVVGNASNRPDNANRDCGVKFLHWGHYVDPLGRANVGTLLMRNMRADPGFDEAIQNVDEPGREAAVMGPYLPRSEYVSERDFAALGCAQAAH